MKIIALAGLGDSGKTGILKELITTMQSSNQFQTISITDPNKPEQTGLFKKYATNILDEKTVYVSTQGDAKDIIINAINKAKVNQADQLILACHTHTNATQTPIIQEDEFANFIGTYKYDKDDWNLLSNKDKVKIKKVYVDRILKEI